MQQHLVVSKALPHPETENSRIKPLRPIEVHNVKAEMIEFKEAHLSFT